MEKQNASCSNLHPLVLVWLGVLTGALIATMIFGYHLFEMTENYKAAMLMMGNSKM